MGVIEIEDKIQFITDNLTNIPTLEKGEPFMVEGGNELYVGNGNENVRISGGSRRNYLHNWDFRWGSLVNQRGLLTYTANGYGIDRWVGMWVDVTIQSESIRITRRTTNNGAAFFQRLEHSGIYYGLPFTLSAILGDGRLVSVSSSIPTANHTSSGATWFGDYALRVWRSIDGTLEVQIWADSAPPNSSIDVVAIKLEFGPTSTLANYTPMDHGKELATCRRYFERISGVDSLAHLGVGTLLSPSPDVIQFLVPFQCGKRIRPVVTLEDWFAIRAYHNSPTAVPASMFSSDVGHSLNQCVLTVPFRDLSSLPTGEGFIMNLSRGDVVFLRGPGNIFISADL